MKWQPQRLFTVQRKVKPCLRGDNVCFGGGYTAHKTKWLTAHLTSFSAWASSCLHQLHKSRNDATTQHEMVYDSLPFHLVSHYLLLVAHSYQVPADHANSLQLSSTWPLLSLWSTLPLKPYNQQMWLLQMWLSRKLHIIWCEPLID